MAKPILDDGLWQIFELFLPKPKRRRKHHPGRMPLEPRKVLTGILFVLKTGLAWEDLPQELGCGCGMTCWNHLHAWHRAGVFRKVHHELLRRLRRAGKLDFSRGVVDSLSLRAVFGGERPARTPRIGPKKAPNTTCLPMRRAFP